LITDCDIALDAERSVSGLHTPEESDVEVIDEIPPVKMTRRGIVKSYTSGEVVRVTSLPWKDLLIKVSNTERLWKSKGDPANTGWNSFVPNEETMFHFGRLNLEFTDDRSVLFFDT